MCEEATRSCVSDTLEVWDEELPGRGVRLTWFDDAYLVASVDPDTSAIVVADPLEPASARSLDTGARGTRLSLSSAPGESVALAWVDPQGFYRIASRAAGAPFGRWSVDIVRSDMNEISPSYIATSDFAVVAGPDGSKELVFRDARAQMLRWATIGAQGWSFEQIDDGSASREVCDEADVVGREPSAVRDTTGGALYVSYHDGICGALRVARRGASGWTRALVDSGDTTVGGARATVGRASSIALTSQGEVGVSYQDRTRGRLYYARQRLGVWERELVDRGEGSARTGQRPKSVVGAFSSLNFDASDVPNIAYFDSGTSSTRLAQRGVDGGWSSEEVVDEGIVGLFVSSASAPAGEGLIVSEQLVAQEDGMRSRMSVSLKGGTR